MGIKVGADPELFVRKGGKLISAHRMIKGTKLKPFPVDKGAVQVDGIALEYNIDPASTVDEFVSHNLIVMDKLKSMLPDQDLNFDISPCADITPEFFKEQPPEAMRLGCDKSYNAFTMTLENVRDIKSLRTSGGHVHLGWGENINMEDSIYFHKCCSLVRELEVFFNVLTLEHSDIEQEKKRKALYGNSGSFRPKPYGLEYRSLSNFWLKDVKLMEDVFNICQVVYDRVEQDELLQWEYYNVELEDITTEQIQEVKRIVSI